MVDRCRLAQVGSIIIDIVCLRGLALFCLCGLAGMERAAKLQKLEDFRRSKPHCSASALSQILTAIKKHGLPELTGRGAMREARDHVAEHDGLYGPVIKTISIELKDGGNMHLPIACPFASLTYALAESDSLKRLFKRQLTLHTPVVPRSPLEYHTVHRRSDAWEPICNSEPAAFSRSLLVASRARDGRP